jgi:hypothetical protein
LSDLGGELSEISLAQGQFVIEDGHELLGIHQMIGCQSLPIGAKD